MRRDRWGPTAPERFCPQPEKARAGPSVTDEDEQEYFRTDTRSVAPEIDVSGINQSRETTDTDRPVAWRRPIAYLLLAGTVILVVLLVLLQLGTAP